MRVLRNLCAFVLIANLSITVVPVAVAQSPCSSYDPNCASRKLSNPSGSVLKKINPDDKDYGQQIEDLRTVLFAKTLDNLLFWSNTVAMFMLLGAGFIILHQHKERRHRQIIAARFLAWYHNQLLDARDRAMEEIGKFERFRQAVEARQIALSSGDNSPTTETNSRSATNDALTTENNSLRQKISLMEKTETALRKENSELKRLLRERPERSTAAKSAAPSGPTAVRKEGDNGKG